MPLVSSFDAEETVGVTGDADVAVVQASVRRICRLAGTKALLGTSLAIAASELATNLLKYAGGGRLTVALKDDPLHILLLSDDEGPGFRDPARALEDGVSADRHPITKEWLHRRGLGCGLGAVKRLTDHLFIWNKHGGGARVVAVKVLER